MISIDSAFDPSTLNIHSFFQQPGIGYYIPLYQREYTWDSDNIEQLLLDLSRGIENCTEDDDEIRFLGTIILVLETNAKDNIEPQDPRGLPSRIDKVIDGQQRLSTIALLATILYDRIIKTENKFPKNNPLTDDILLASKDWKKKLTDVFSLDLGRGNPERKPKIIRGSIDQWTMDGEIQENYKSPVSKYLSEFISYVFDKKSQPQLNSNSKVDKNVKQIEKWLKNDVELAHVNNNSDFLPAWEIIEKLDENYIWQYEKPDLVCEILKKDTIDKKSISFLACSIVQLFSVCHYLLDRCCFTVIKPTKDDWAFDLFQSLNATGTPLTAIETFSPLVVNNTAQHEQSYISSKTKQNFENIENLFLNTNTAAQKNKLTNDFLTSLAITTKGIQLSSHFSHQRKWLNKTYIDSANYDDQKSLISFFGNYAIYYKNVWIDYSGSNAMPIEKINSHTDSDLSSLLILFLKYSKHKMSITVLGRFYDPILNGKAGSIKNFIEASKIITSFYILWRSVKSNSGLDKSYREFFKELDGHNWINQKDISLKDLKEYLKDILSNIGINNKENWKELALSHLKYDNSKNICKMILLIAFNQTIPDDDSPGLMKLGASGVSPYLILGKWNSPDLKTIEHIAPQSNHSDWDTELYSTESKIYQTIGNLTLLPTEVNSSAGNKGWVEKLLYYKHISEKDPSKKQELQLKAQDEGIKLNPQTLEILENVNYSEHMEALVRNGEKIIWNKEFVEIRSERILDLAWSKLSDWFY
jgi:hypothetical protein